MKFDSTLTKIITADMTTGRIVPSLMGEPGIGKTSFAKDLAEYLDTKVFIIQANQLDEKADLTGVRTVPTPDGKSWMQIFFPHATIHEVNEYAAEHPDENPILLIDEINRTEPDVTSALLSLSTERVCGNTRLEDNIRIMVTGNTKGNVNSLDSASLSRFSIYNVDADADVFLDIMGDKLNPHIREVLVENPEYIFIKPANANETFTAQAASGNPDEDDEAGTYLFSSEEEMLQFTTPRTIEGLSNWLNAVDDDLLRELLHQETSGNRSMLTATIEAHTGDTAFSATLAGRIVEQLNTSRGRNSGSAGVTVRMPSEPASYSSLINAQYAHDIDRIVGALDDDELQELFLYALCSRPTQQQRLILTTTAQAITAPINGFNRKFSTYLANGLVPNDNLDILDSSSAKIYDDILRPIVNIMAP